MACQDLMIVIIIVTPFRKPADAVAASQSEYSLVQYKNRTFP